MSSYGGQINSLSIETSGRVGSVAVAGDDQLLATDRFSTREAHGAELAPSVKRLCDQCGVTPDGLHHVYVSGGPGSFTGLRVGVTFARTLALATDARLVRVPTLTVVAQNALTLDDPPDRVAVLLDAKRRHAFAATFERSEDAYIRIDDPAEREPGSYLAGVSPIAVMGDGVAYHSEVISQVDNAWVLPDALNRARAEIVFQLGRAMASRGEFIEPDRLIPIYIRRPDAEEKWEQRQADRETT